MNYVIKVSSQIREDLKACGIENSGIEKACDLMIKTINDIKSRTPKKLLDTLENNIDELLDHFDFCKSFATGEIQENEYVDYDFDGNILEMFNDYLKEFWDMCDTFVDKDVRYCFVRL